MWPESTWRAEIYCEPKGHKSGLATSCAWARERNGRERGESFVKLKRDKRCEFATPARKDSLFWTWYGGCILSN